MLNNSKIINDYLSLIYLLSFWMFSDILIIFKFFSIRNVQIGKLLLTK